MGFYDENNQSEHNYSWNREGDIYYSSKQYKKMSPKRIIALVIGGVLLFAVCVLAGFGVMSIYDNSLAKPQEQQNNNNPSSSNSPSMNIVSIQDNADKTIKQAGEPLSTVEIVDKVKPSVVGIVSKIASNGFEGQAAGSGVVMSADGYIITNYHVIADATEVKVIFEDNKEYQANIIGADQKSDLAVLKINANNLTYAEFGDSTILKVGEPVVAIGNPMGMELFGTTTAGIISATNRTVTIEDRVMTLIQTDAAINEGNSGGPLINQYGQVIGINSAKIASNGMGSGVEGLGFAIPTENAKPIIDSLIQFGYVKDRPVIGITGTDVSENMARYYDMPQGVLVRSVTEGSGAQKAGIQADDVITKANGVIITNMSELNAQKEKFKAGDTMGITVYRNGRTMNLDVLLTEEKPISVSK